MSGALSEFLKSEYVAAGKEPVCVRIYGRNYVVPYVYVRDYANFQKAFLTDFFDSQHRDLQLYQKSGQPLQYISWSKEGRNGRLLVPFYLRYKNLTSQQIADMVFTRADKIYQKAVRLAFKLSKIFPNGKYQTIVNINQIKLMQKAYYEYQLKNTKNDALYITNKVSAFLCRNVVKITDNLKHIKIADLKMYARNWGVRLMLTATVSAAVYDAVNRSENTN